MSAITYQLFVAIMPCNYVCSIKSASVDMLCAWVCALTAQLSHTGKSIHH